MHTSAQGQVPNGLLCPTWLPVVVMDVMARHGLSSVLRVLLWSNAGSQCWKRESVTRRTLAILYALCSASSWLPTWQTPGPAALRMPAGIGRSKLWVHSAYSCSSYRSNRSPAGASTELDPRNRAECSRAANS